MRELKIQFDYLNGPVWKEKLDISTGEWATGIPCVDNDKAIQTLDAEAGRLYESLYSFDEQESGCRFDEAKFGLFKNQLLSLVDAIIGRLSAINDGSFRVIDNATSQLR